MNTPEYGCVYLIACLANDKVYVGQSADKRGGFQRRWARHLRDAKTTTSKALYAAIRKHGPEQFTIQKIASATNKESLDNLESFYIILLDAMNPEKGYNRRTGGSRGLHSDETKAVMKVKRASWKPTEEHKTKIGNSLRGRHYHSEENKQKCRERLLGNTFGAFKRTDEQKRNMNVPHKTYTVTPAVIEAAKLRAQKRPRNSEGKFT